MTNNNILNMTDEEFGAYMYQTFPSLFDSKDTSYIFEIGPGWRHVLCKLSTSIKSITEKYNIDIKYQQIKEKFGTARFYISICDSTKKDIYNPKADNTETDKEIALNIIYDIISKAEVDTTYICDTCGNIKDGVIATKSWYYGSCEACLIKQKPSMKYELSYRKYIQKIIAQFEKTIYNVNDIKTIKNITKFLNKNLKEKK